MNPSIKIIKHKPIDGYETIRIPLATKFSLDEDYQKDFVNSRIANLIETVVENGGVTLYLNETDFESALKLYKIVRETGNLKLLNRFQPLAVGVIAETTDGNIILHRRSENVAVAKGEYNIPCGYCSDLNKWDDEEVDIFDPFAQIEYEIYEEMGIPRDEIDSSKLHAVGITHGTYTSLNPMVVFIYELGLDTGKIDNFFKEEKRYEASQLFILPADKSEKFIKGEFRKDPIGNDFMPNEESKTLGIVDNTLGALAVYLSLKDEKSYENVRDFLAENGIAISEAERYGNVYKFVF